MKNALLLIYFMILLNPVTGFSQGWERIYEGEHDEFFYDTDLSPDGGLIISGIQDSTSGFKVPFIFKTDTEGKILWSFYDTAKASAFTQSYDLLVVSDGSILFSNVSVDSTVIPWESHLFLQKLNSSGELMWSKQIEKEVLSNVRDIFETIAGDFILIGDIASNEAGIARFDANGNKLWNQQLIVSGVSSFDISSAIETTGEDILVAGNTDFRNERDMVLTRLNSSGTVLWQRVYTQPNDQLAMDIVENQPNRYTIAVGNIADTVILDASLWNVDQNGDQLWLETISGYQALTGLRLRLALTSSGIALAGSTPSDINSNIDFRLTLLDQSGAVLNTHTYKQNHPNWLFDLTRTADGGFYLSGAILQANNSIDGYVVRTDNLGNSFTNQITGKVFFDEDADCLLTSPSVDMENWIVKAEKRSFEMFSTTDSAGNYSFDVDTGTYQIIVFPPASMWSLCEDTTEVSFTQFFESQQVDFSAQANTLCPMLEVSVSTPFLRRCFDNTYHIGYCNIGTIAAEDAFVELTLDPEMTYLNSSVPFSSQSGQVYTFDLGDLAIGDCGDFSVEVLLGCDSVLLGKTHCVEALIFPDSICDFSGTWSGASIKVEGSCQGDSLFFFIENIGLAPTQGAIDYIVIEDDVILMQGDFDLQAGEKQQLAFETTGATYRMEADQEEGHPGNSSPSVTIEGCTDGNNPPSLGFVTSFPQDDGDSFIDIDCQENIGAYDPNDKSASPKGFYSEHIIKQNQDLEYLIRFQNTGTDTAFNVDIVDTLSAFLDPTSIRLGASSHPVDFDLSGSGIMRFRFRNIMLPDSNVNEAASNGFVRFRISQYPDLPLGTLILNEASIYFDFNAPVITNQTLHTIGNLRVLVDVENVWKENAEIKVYPNPFIESSTFEIKGLEDLEKGEIAVYNSLGVIVKKQNFSAAKFTLERGPLSGGIYFFQLLVDGELLGSGRLLVQ